MSKISETMQRSAVAKVEPQSTLKSVTISTAEQEK